jgi:hypothetical protein
MGKGQNRQSRVRRGPAVHSDYDRSLLFVAAEVDRLGGGPPTVRELGQALGNRCLAAPQPGLRFGYGPHRSLSEALWEMVALGLVSRQLVPGDRQAESGWDDLIALTPVGHAAVGAAPADLAARLGLES